MRNRMVFATGGALLVGVLLGGLLGPTTAEAISKKETIQLLADVTRLLQGQRELQRTFDEKQAVLKTLVEQQFDASNRLNVSIGSLQKSLLDVQASGGARTDTLATQVQALGDNLDDVKSRLSRLSQQMSDSQGVLQSLDAKLAGGAPMTDTSAPGATTAPPPSAETLYSSALRDYTGGKYDLARQQFLDYLKFFPENDMASNSQFYLGEILYAQKQFKEAIGEYDKVLEGYPKSFKLADARLKKGFALLELGQRASAQRELREVVRRHPGTEASRRANARLRELSAAAPGE